MLKSSRFFLLIFSASIFVVGVIAEDDPIISFKDGRIGVNFLGYKASAGLGGILTGNSEHGGLHASASTPFGQKASAGGSGILSDRSNAGGLFAKAQTGYGQKAAAGIGGIQGTQGMDGALFAGADNGYGSSSGKIAYKGSDPNRLQEFLTRLFNS